MIQIFLASPRQTEEEKRLYSNFRNAFRPCARPFTVGVDVIPSTRVEITDLEWENIRKSHALVAIVAGRHEIDGTITAISVYQEISFANRLNKPVYLFLEENARLEGGIDVKAVETFTFNRSDIFTEEGKYWLVDVAHWIVQDVHQKIPGALEAPEDLLPLVGAAVGGIIEFFRPGFLPRWLRVPAGSVGGGLAGEGLRRLVKDLVKR